MHKGIHREIYTRVKTFARYLSHSGLIPTPYIILEALPREILDV